MTKILILVGTNRKSIYSNSVKVANMIKDRFKNKSNNCLVEILCLSDYNIQLCKGCITCFCTGNCTIDDDMTIIKEKMLSANHIMFVSPVYAHNVPGVLKNFIDRCSSWLHIFKLLGKTSSSVVVTSSNGQIFVSDYLKKVLELLGTIYIKGFEITVDNPPMLEQENDMNIVLQKFITDLYEGINGEIPFNKIQRQCAAFNFYKNTYSNSNIDSFEVHEWNTDEELKKSSFLQAYRFRKMKLENNNFI